MKGITTLAVLAAAGAGYVVWQRHGRQASHLQATDRAALGAARLWATAQVEAADAVLRQPTGVDERGVALYARRCRAFYRDFERKLAAHAGDIEVPDADELRHALEAAGLVQLRGEDDDMVHVYRGMALRSHQIGLVWLNERLLPLVWDAQARKLLQSLRAQVIRQLDLALQLTRNTTAIPHAGSDALPASEPAPATAQLAATAGGTDINAPR